MVAIEGRVDSTFPLALPLTDLLSATEAGRLTSLSGSSECCRFDVEFEFWRMRDEAGLEMGSGCNCALPSTGDELGSRGEIVI